MSTINLMMGSCSSDGSINKIGTVADYPNGESVQMLDIPSFLPKSINEKGNVMCGFVGEANSANNQFMNYAVGRPMVVHTSIASNWTNYKCTYFPLNIPGVDYPHQQQQNLYNNYCSDITVSEDGKYLAIIYSKPYGTQWSVGFFGEVRYPTYFWVKNFLHLYKLKTPEDLLQENPWEFVSSTLLPNLDSGTGVTTRKESLGRVIYSGSDIKHGHFDLSIIKTGPEKYNVRYFYYMNHFYPLGVDSHLEEMTFNRNFNDAVYTYTHELTYTAAGGTVLNEAYIANTSPHVRPTASPVGAALVPWDLIISDPSSTTIYLPVRWKHKTLNAFYPLSFSDDAETYRHQLVLTRTKPSAATNLLHRMRILYINNAGTRMIVKRFNLESDTTDAECFEILSTNSNPIDPVADNYTCKLFRFKNHQNGFDLMNVSSNNNIGLCSWASGVDRNSNIPATLFIGNEGDYPNIGTFCSTHNIEYTYTKRINMALRPKVGIVKFT